MSVIEHNTIIMHVNIKLMKINYRSKHIYFMQKPKKIWTGKKMVLPECKSQQLVQSITWLLLFNNSQLLVRIIVLLRLLSDWFSSKLLSFLRRQLEATPPHHSFLKTSPLFKKKKKNRNLLKNHEKMNP